MASLGGFQLKNIKNTMGIEGPGLIATMYLDGEKIGTYADYGDGAMEQVDYVSKEARQKMVEFIIDYAQVNPNDFIVNLYKQRPKQYEEECKRFKEYNPFIPDEKININTMSANSIVYAVEDFLKLNEVEKVYKGGLKKGYSAVSSYGSQNPSFKRNVVSYPASWSEDKISEEAKKFGHDKVYYSLEDFNISKEALLGLENKEKDAEEIER